VDRSNAPSAEAGDATGARNEEGGYYGTDKDGKEIVVNAKPGEAMKDGAHGAAIDDPDKTVKLNATSSNEVTVNGQVENLPIGGYGGSHCEGDKTVGDQTVNTDQAKKSDGHDINLKEVQQLARQSTHYVAVENAVKEAGIKVNLLKVEGIGAGSVPFSNAKTGKVEEVSIKIGSSNTKNDAVIGLAWEMTNASNASKLSENDNAASEKGIGMKEYVMSKMKTDAEGAITALAVSSDLKIESSSAYGKFLDDNKENYQKYAAGDMTKEQLVNALVDWEGKNSPQTVNEYKADWGELHQKFSEKKKAEK